MMFRTTLAAALALVSSAAVAHDTVYPHVHPHGADVALLALGVAALAFGGYKTGVLSAIRNRRDR